MLSLQKPNEVELLDKGIYSHWHLKLHYVLLTLVLEDTKAGWTEEQIIERFKKLGTGAPEAYQPMSYIAKLEELRYVTSKIENFNGDEKNVRRVYRPTDISVFIRIELP